MATVTKPIALDESLNTTELSSRNVADVLAQELQAVAGAIGGIAVPSADHVSYDNSVSGLSATDVQNALDEIVSDIPTVNNGTLTIQQNGTSIGTFSANTASNVTANIKTPTADKKTATTEFDTADGGLLSKCMIDLVPVQSGSGEPSPDNVRPISGHTEVDLQVDGKNRLIPNLVSETKNDVTLTVHDDGTITLNGLATATTQFYNALTNITEIEIGESYILSGCPSGGSGTTYALRPMKTSSTWYSDDFGNGVTFTADSTNLFVNIIIRNGYNCNNLTFKPMLRKASVTDPTFEPYLGHLYQVQIGSTVYVGYVDLVTGVMTATHAFMTFNGTENWQIGSGNAYLGIVGMKSGNNQWGLCSILPRGIESGCILFGYTNTRIYIMDCVTAYELDTANKVKAFMNGAEIVYPLDTPLTIQLTPQQIEALVGQNNLSTPLDGQSIDSVEYREVFAFDDVEKVVSLRVPISMLGTDESGRTTASQSYASGDYFYKDGYMCKALTSISAGATLTLNTNYSASTLADILKILSQ